MNSALVRKELRQHFMFLLLTLLVISAATLITFAVVQLSGASGNPYDALKICVVIYVPFMGWMLSNLLVIHEYRSKTQLFLEVLPLSRASMLLTKYFLGLFFIVLYLLITTVLAAVLSLRISAFDLTLFGSVVLRVAAFSFFFYNLFFLSGFLGRYRLFLLIGLVCGCMVVQSATTFELTRFGPLECLDDTFGYESRTLPTFAIMISFALGAIFLIGSLCMVSLKEGDLATRLGHKMSQREKIFIACIIVAIISTMLIFDERKTKEPYTMQDVQVVEEGGVTIHLSPSDSQKGKAFATALAQELSVLKDLLDLPSKIPIFLTEQSNLDYDEYQRGVLLANEGLLVGVNFSHPEFSANDFSRYVLWEYLDHHTDGRVHLESRKWVPDGFLDNVLLFNTGLRNAKAADAMRDQLLLRALYARPEGPSEETLRDWHKLTEEVGLDIGQGLAWSGMEVLQELMPVSAVASTGEDLYARKYSPEFLAFTRRMMGFDESPDFRALWQKRRTTLPRMLEAFAQSDTDDFLARWKAYLAAEHLRLGDELDALPRLVATYTIDQVSKHSCTITAELNCAPAMPKGTGVWFSYKVLNPLEYWAMEDDLERHFIPSLEDAAAFELPVTVQPGDRVYASFEIFVPELGCEVASGWVTIEVPQ